MLYRKYGSRVHKVEPDFDPNAMTEISFRRDRSTHFPVLELEERYEKLREERLGAETEGRVQVEAEAAVLRELQDEIDALVEGMGEGEILLVENEMGLDYPKIRDRKRGFIEDGKNKLSFHWTVDPVLRIGVYRRRDS